MLRTALAGQARTAYSRLGARNKINAGMLAIAGAI